MDDTAERRECPTGVIEKSKSRKVEKTNESKSAWYVVVSLVALGLTGCSVFVNAGRMILGDLTAEAAFSAQTGVDLVKEEKTVLVVCSTPHAIKSDYPSVEPDLVAGISRRLKVRGIKVADADKVATWMDDHGGYWEDPTELARAFDVDYIIHVNLNEFTLREPNSPSLWRGHVEGTILAYEVVSFGGQEMAQVVFEREYISDYPKFNPVAAERKSLKIFGKEYLDHISGEAARYFHDYSLTEEL